MVNITNFTKRLQKVIDYYGESASSFAEKIGVQRSSISHILSGRNKPSLDFVLKVISAYSEVDLYWLLNGKGTFPKTENANTEKPTQSKIAFTSSTPTSAPSEINQKIKTAVINDKTIERIVIFFKDGSFKNYEQ